MGSSGWSLATDSPEDAWDIQRSDKTMLIRRIIQWVIASEDVGLERRTVMVKSVNLRLDSGRFITFD